MASFFEKLKKGMGIEEGVEEITEEIKEPEIEEEVGKETVKPVKKIQVKKARKEVIHPPIDETKENEKEEIIFEEPKIPPVIKKVKKFEVKTLKIKEMPKKEIKEKVEIKEEKPISEAVPIEMQISSQKDEKWPELKEQPAGQLAIDVYQTENDLVIQSAIAGIKPETLDISMEKDIINIKGKRQKPFEENGDYFSQECFWGPFLREIILPADVDPNRAEATMKDGILTIRIPKILREKKRTIVVRG